MRSEWLATAVLDDWQKEWPTKQYVRIYICFANSVLAVYKSLNIPLETQVLHDLHLHFIYILDSLNINQRNAPSLSKFNSSRGKLYTIIKTLIVKVHFVG